MKNTKRNFTIKFKESDKIFLNKLEKVDIKNLNKESLLKLIDLYDTVSGSNIINIIANHIKKIQNDETLKKIFDIKINSLLNEISTKKYIKKIDHKSFTRYVYETHSCMYMKNFSDTTEIVNELIEINPKEIMLFHKNKRKLLTEINKDTINIIDDFIKNSSKSDKIIIK